MKLYYVKTDKDWDNLDIGDSVIFDLPTIRLKYSISKIHVYWLHSKVYLNDRIFNELGITDKYGFVNSIINYRVTGGFPNVHSLDDLKKVIKALDDECVKRFGIPKETSTESKEGKEVSPSELKEGDYIRLRSLSTNFLHIVRKITNNSIYRYAAYDINNYELYTNNDGHWSLSTNTKITYATPEEKKLLDDALLKKGYIWNGIAKQLQKIDTITIDDSTGTIAIPKEYRVNDGINRVNPAYIPSHIKYSVFVDTDKEEAKEELNLFPTKKHYQLNFNY